MIQEEVSKLMVSGYAASVISSGLVPEEDRRERGGHIQLPTLLRQLGTEEDKMSAVYRRESSASTTASVVFSEEVEERSQEFDLKTPIACIEEYTLEPLETAASPLWLATVQFCSSHVYRGAAECFTGMLEILRKKTATQPEQGDSGEHTSLTSYSCREHTALTAYSSRPSASNLVMWEDDEGNWQFADLTSPRRRRSKRNT